MNAKAVEHRLRDLADREGIEIRRSRRPADSRRWVIVSGGINGRPLPGELLTDAELARWLARRPHHPPQRF